MAQHSCHSEEQASSHSEQESCCHPQKSRPDYLLWGSMSIVTALYILHFGFSQQIVFIRWLQVLSSAAFELINTMWWGVALGIVMLAILSKIPREFVMSVLGTGLGFKGILRAVSAGVLLDLCSHGILMVAAKLYERGATIGQVMAFLIASPWNSFSLTLILFALIGVGWTLLFVALSAVIAIVTGVLFDALVARGTLPSHPVQSHHDSDFKFWSEASRRLSGTQFSLQFFIDMLIHGIKESRMVIRWLLFGVVLASLIRAFAPDDFFGHYFGPTVVGLLFTVLAATVIEVCSEGSSPIAADLMNRANAPGNSFAFLMAGAATDYTEVMVMREQTKSWKIALFLPLLTVPQVMLVAWLINSFSI